MCQWIRAKRRRQVVRAYFRFQRLAKILTADLRAAQDWIVCIESKIGERKNGEKKKLKSPQMKHIWLRAPFSFHFFFLLLNYVRRLYLLDLALVWKICVLYGRRLLCIRAISPYSGESTYLWNIFIINVHIGVAWRMASSSPRQPNYFLFFFLPFFPCQCHTKNNCFENCVKP